MDHGRQARNWQLGSAAGSYRYRRAKVCVKRKRLQLFTEVVEPIATSGTAWDIYATVPI